VGTQLLLFISSSFLNQIWTNALTELSVEERQLVKTSLDLILVHASMPRRSMQQQELAVDLPHVPTMINVQEMRSASMVPAVVQSQIWVQTVKVSNNYEHSCGLTDIGSGWGSESPNLNSY